MFSVQLCGEALTRADWLDCDRGLVTGLLDPLRRVDLKPSEFAARFPLSTLRWMFVSADQTMQPLPGHRSGLYHTTIN